MPLFWIVGYRSEKMNHQTIQQNFCSLVALLIFSMQVKNRLFLSLDCVFLFHFFHDF